MRGWILYFCAAATLTACTTESQNSQSETYWWSYVCGKDQGMAWSFQEGQKGQFQFDGGSILKPVNPDDPADRLFKRQDGEQFMITGNGDAWTVTRVTSEKAIKCRRVREPNNNKTVPMDVLAEPGMS